MVSNITLLELQLQPYVNLEILVAIQFGEMDCNGLVQTFGDWDRKCVTEWYRVTREIEKAISRRQAQDEDN